MTEDVAMRDDHRGSPWRILGWGAAVVLLLLPFFAMQVTSEVNWTVGDFLFAAIVIGLAGTLAELAVRMSSNWSYRAGAGFAIAAAFLIVWVNAAVGMIGDGANLYNLLFLGIVPVALAGAAVARFRAGRMAVAMALAGVAHIAVALVGMGSDLHGGIFSAVMGGLWFLSAALFRSAATGRSRG